MRPQCISIPRARGSHLEKQWCQRRTRERTWRGQVAGTWVSERKHPPLTVPAPPTSSPASNSDATPFIMEVASDQLKSKGWGWAPSQAPGRPQAAAELSNLHTHRFFSVALDCRWVRLTVQLSWPHQVVVMETSITLSWLHLWTLLPVPGWISRYGFPTTCSVSFLEYQPWPLKWDECPSPKKESVSCVRLFVNLWTVACQAPLSMGFSRQEHQSGSPCPPPGDLPDLGMEPASPALQADSLSSEPLVCLRNCKSFRGCRTPC